MKQGLLGKKLSHSYSVKIHDEFYKITNKKGEYNLYEIDNVGNIENFLKRCNEEKIYNLNVTIPYKKDVIKYMDFLSDAAKKIDAVNTINIKNNKFYGYNSDYFGFIKALEKENINVKDTKWVILGNGGAAKSIYVALSDLKAKDIKIVSRVKKDQRHISYEHLDNLYGYDGLVNTTPVGMFPNVDECVIEEKLFQRYSYAIDLVYNPEMTLFLKYAKANNLKYANGMYMLVAQAIKSQEIWNDETYDQDIIEQIYNIMVKEL